MPRTGLDYGVVVVVSIPLIPVLPVDSGITRNPANCG